MAAIKTIPSRAVCSTSEALHRRCAAASVGGGARLIKDERMSETKRKVRIRKLTETEVFRLMDVDEKYIERMRNSGVSRTKMYFAADNSIVVSCMEYIFENLFYPQEGAARQDANGQLSLF
jgi:site-specific DNA-cytosine methylase